MGRGGRPWATATNAYRRITAHPTIARIIAKSAIASGESVGIDTLTVVVTLAELFDGVGSGVVEAIVTVFDVDVPAGVLSGTLNVNWNVALAPALNDAIVQTTEPNLRVFLSRVSLEPVRGSSEGIGSRRPRRRSRPPRG